MHKTDSILYALFEAPDGDATDLNFARDDLHRVIEKTQKSERAAGNRRLFQTALHITERREEKDCAPDA